MRETLEKRGAVGGKRFYRNVLVGKTIRRPLKGKPIRHLASGCSTGEPLFGTYLEQLFSGKPEKKLGANLEVFTAIFSREAITYTIRGLIVGVRRGAGKGGGI